MITMRNVPEHDELPLAYATVLGWAHEHGHEPRGPVLETYLNDPRATPEHELATRVAVLLA
jgi:effector-binding domain-containing protein